MRKLVTGSLLAVAIGFSAYSALAEGPMAAALTRPPSASTAVQQPNALRGTSGFSVLKKRRGGAVLSFGNGQTGASLLSGTPQVGNPASHESAMQK